MVEGGIGQASLMGRKLGNYEVRSLIGCGAMGAVYLAQDLVLNRPVALKVMLGSLARNAEQVRRFQREAQAAAPLIHQNIVRIYEAGVRSGTPFIAMEYVEGESFFHFIERTGPMPWRHALELADQVARALDCAHAHGVVHRDIKPANILVDKQGRVRLTDFGIAKVRDQGTGLTDHGQFIGTPEYMSPEQCSGVAAIGPASDLFSLGVTLYRMISGVLPFQGGSTAALIAGITLDTPVRLNKLLLDVPDDVARLVAHLMEKDPAQRPESAAALSDMIGKLLSNDGGQSVMNDALTAFIREQRAPHADRTPSPTPREKPRGAKPVIKRNRAVKYQPISAGAKAAVFALATLALAGAGYWNFMVQPPKAEAAPLLERAVFAQAAPGVFLHTLPAGWVAAGLSWDSRESRVLLHLAGRPGSPWHGGEGWLAADPDTGEITVPRAPRSPLADPEFAVHAARQPRVQAAGGAFALALAWGSDDGIALVRQPLNQLEPIAAPEAVVTAREWGARSAWDAPGIEPGAFLLDPRGAAYLVRASERGGAEFAAARPGGVDVLHTETRAVPGESVQLSPDGDAIWYLCRESGGRRALHRLAPLAAGAQSASIAAGSLGDSYAIAPGGHRVAVESQDRAASALYDTSGALVRGDLAAGGVHPQAWHPSGTFYLVARDDGVYAQEALGEFAEESAAQFSGAVAAHAAISPGGRWAAAIIDDGTTAHLAFIDVSGLASASGADT